MPRGFAFPRGAELPAPFQFGLRTDVWTRSCSTRRDVRNYDVQNLVAIRGRLSQRCGNGACSASVAQAELTANAQTRNIPVNDQPKSAYQLVSMVDIRRLNVSGGPLHSSGRRRLRARDAAANVTTPPGSAEFAHASRACGAIGVGSDAPGRLGATARDRDASCCVSWVWGRG